MVDRKDPLPVVRQCELLDLPRSTFYHAPKPVTEDELELMALIASCPLTFSSIATSTTQRSVVFVFRMR